MCLTALLVDMLLLLLQLLSTLFDSSIFLRSFRVGLGSQRCPEEEVWGFWCEIFYLCAGCPSCHPTSSVKARQQYAVSSISSLSFIDVFSLSVSFLFDYRVFFTWSASWLVLVHFWSPQEKNIRDCWRENFYRLMVLPVACSILLLSDHWSYSGCLCAVCSNSRLLWTFGYPTCIYTVMG